MRNFDINIAREYNFIKDCPEHQAITWIESNGWDARPVFYRQIHHSLAFLDQCLSAGEYQPKYLSVNIWDSLREVYGITNVSHNSLINGLTIDEIINEYGLPVMLSCDSFCLPYSKNYHRAHAGTRVILLDVDHDIQQYLIGEAPFHICEWVDKELILEAHRGEQPGRGYYHLPRFPTVPHTLMEIGRLIAELETELHKSLSEQQNENLDLRVDAILQSPHFGEPSQLIFVLECFMHLQAGWMKLAKCIAWLNEDYEMTNMERIHSALNDMINAWKRMQMDYVKLLRKPHEFEEKIREKLVAIRKQECSVYRILIEYLRELSAANAR